MVDRAGCDVGSARRRRERRLPSWLRHERMAVAAELAAALHHSRDGRRATNDGECPLHGGHVRLDGPEDVGDQVPAAGQALQGSALECAGPSGAGVVSVVTPRAPTPDPCAAAQVAVVSRQFAIVVRHLAPPPPTFPLPLPPPPSPPSPPLLPTTTHHHHHQASGFTGQLCVNLFFPDLSGRHGCWSRHWGREEAARAAAALDASARAADRRHGACPSSQA